MAVGDTILSLINALIQPTWHLVLLFCILFVVVIIHYMSKLGF